MVSTLKVCGKDQLRLHMKILSPSPDIPQVFRKYLLILGRSPLNSVTDPATLLTQKCAFLGNPNPSTQRQVASPEQKRDILRSPTASEATKGGRKYHTALSDYKIIKVISYLLSPLPPISIFYPRSVFY